MREDVTLRLTARYEAAFVLTGADGSGVFHFGVDAILEAPFDWTGNFIDFVLGK